MAGSQTESTAPPVNASTPNTQRKYEYGPGNNCWLCGADINRVCWCHDEGADLSKTRGYNGICRCPE
jgi:hypothetical protein